MPRLIVHGIPENASCPPPSAMEINAWVKIDDKFGYVVLNENQTPHTFDKHRDGSPLKAGEDVWVFVAENPRQSPTWELIEGQQLVKLREGDTHVCFRFRRRDAGRMGALLSGPYNAKREGLDSLWPLTLTFRPGAQYLSCEISGQGFFARATGFVRIENLTAFLECDTLSPKGERGHLRAHLGLVEPSPGTFHPVFGGMMSIEGSNFGFTFTKIHGVQWPTRHIA